MNLFLRAKHWQLFLVLFGIPLVLQIFLVTSMMMSAFSGSPDPEAFIHYFKVFPVIMILTMGIFFGWFWSIGVGLHQKVPEHIKLPVNRFKTFIIIPSIYIIFFSSFIGWMMGRAFQDGFAPDPRLFLVIVPLHFFCMFCMLYCIYFVAKTVKTIELQREVTFSDFAGEFFLIWFYPVGIWIIQPKVNKFAQA
jgi:hypothetical protein